MIDRIRFSGLFNLQDWPVTLIGAGGIGAITAITLGKMGVPVLSVFDGDVVSIENTGTQFFSSFDVGIPKVEALGGYLENFAEDVPYLYAQERVTPETDREAILNPIIISAVDSIQARKDIWSVVSQAPFLWYLEARMGAEVFQLYSVRYGDHQWYADLIAGQDDDMVPDLPCTAKATYFTASLSAGFLGKTVRQIATGLTPPRVLIHDIVNDCLTKLGS